MKLADRILTIVITATLTSAVWIVFGGTFLSMAGEAGDDADSGQLASDTGGVDAPADAVADEAPAQSSTPVEGDEASDPDQLIIPVAGVEAEDLTDSFLDQRGEGGLRRHEAIDIMAEEGTEVVAANAGTIAKLHNSAAGGNSIYLRSADRMTIHFYAHLDSYASGLGEGQRVRAGQRLGTVGSTGNAEDSAPHLHFAILETTEDAEWWEPGNAVNPYPLLTAAE